MLIAAASAKQLKRSHGNSPLSNEDQRYLLEFERLRDYVRDRARSVAERYQNGCYITGRTGADDGASGAGHSEWLRRA